MAKNNSVILDRITNIALVALSCLLKDPVQTIVHRFSKTVDQSTSSPKIRLKVRSHAFLESLAALKKTRLPA